MLPRTGGSLLVIDGIKNLLKFEKQMKRAINSRHSNKAFSTPPNKFEGANQVSLVIQRLIGTDFVDLKGDVKWLRI